MKNQYKETSLNNLNLSLLSIETDEEREQIRSALQDGINSEFWKILKKVLEENKEIILDDLVNDLSFNTGDNNNLKVALKILDFISNFPKRQIDCLYPPKAEEESEGVLDDDEGGVL